MSSTIAYDQVADLYDNYVKADFDIPFFLNEAKLEKGAVLELRSGTGRVSLPVLRAGVRLTCVDLSGEMLARLRDKLAEEHLAADVYQMDVRELAIGKQFSLIFIPFHAFSELVSTEDQRAALGRIHTHLASGGRFIITLHNPPIRLKNVDGTLRLTGKQRVGENENLLFWMWQSYDPSTRIVSGLQFYEQYDAQGHLEFKRMLEIRFALITRAEFAELAAAVGFRVQALYGNYDCSPFDEETSPFQIWILTK